MIQNFFMRRLQYNQQTRRFFMTIVALGFTIDGVFSVLLNLYMLRLGYDTPFIGQVNSVGLMTFALVSFPAGLFGSWWTSSRMLRIGLGSILIGATLLPFVECIPVTWQGLWLMVTYSMTLAGFSLYFVNSAPFLMSVVEPDKQNNAFAMQTALLALAAFVGSLVGGNLPSLFAQGLNVSLDAPAPYRYTLLLTSIVVLLAFLITMTIIEPPSREDESDEADEVIEKRKNHTLTRATIIVIVIMSVVRFLQVAGVATVSIFFNVYMDTVLEMSPNLIGTIAAIARIIAVPAALIAPFLIRRSSIGAVATLASLATGLCLLPIAFIPSEWAAASGYISAIAMSNMRFTAFIVYIMLLVPKNRQPMMAGAGEASAGLSFAIMALSGGYIASIFSFSELFLLGAILTSLGTFIFWLYLRKNPAKEKRQASDAV